jgi:methionyl aminopeptidase
MIHIKTKTEIETMRQAGRLLGKILHQLGEAVKPGVSPLDIENHAEALFKEYNAIPGFKGFKGFPNICCISVNDHVVHGIPAPKPMKAGDLVTIDCGVKLDGLNTDAAISVIVGGDAAGTERTRKLNQTTRKAMYQAIRLVKPGVKVGTLGNIIQKTVEGAGLTIIKDLMGHGVGYELHEEPQILNYGKKDTGIALKPGMTIAIEPIVSAGERFIETLDDGWTIGIKDGSWGCQWEHTILVTDHGHEILTEWV